MAARKPGLTPKQSRFIEEYLVDCNGTQAAIRAGYSPRTACDTAHKMLKTAPIAEAVAVKREALARKVEITAESIARELEEARLIAIREKQGAAAVSASMGKAKLMGLIVERHKHTGAIGGYDLSKVTDADLEKLERILGAAATDPGGDPGGEAAPGG